MLITITDLETAKVHLESERFNKILSLVDPDTELKKYGSNHTIRRFHDISRPFDGRLPPTVEDIKAIMSFANEIQTEVNVLIHCAAGVSRSPAAAIIIFMTLGNKARVSFNQVYKMRWMMDPNPLMLRIFGELTGRLKEIEEAYQEFVDTRRTTKSGLIIP